MNATTATPLPLGPLDPERSELLRRVVDGLQPDTLQWLSGFASGIAYARSQGNLALADPAAHTPAPAATRPEASGRLAIVYGSQTGNGKRVAERLGRAAEAAGIAARVYAARDYPLKDLAKERLLTIVMSTHGDGDPPDDARGFIDFLAGRRAPKLDNLAYSVLALGDSSYPKFCETGRQVDERLAALGARRLLARVDCDVDYERLAAPWVEQVVTVARDALGGPQIATVTRLRAPPQAHQYSRERPFVAPVIANQRIVGRNASKDVRHLELSLEGSGLTYEPGDALGVWHDNPAHAVNAVLGVLAPTGDEAVSLDGQTRPLRDWLTFDREITRLTRPFLAQHAARAASAELAEVLTPGHEPGLRSTLKDLQLVDVLHRYRAWEPKRWCEPCDHSLHACTRSRRARSRSARRRTSR
jgi:sulfite reductase (NADPH) flavoprotein alpha-component